MSEPLPEFSPWFRWHDRRQFALLMERFGVYLLARINALPPQGSANPLTKEVVYIGKATRQMIVGRLEEFGKAAFGDGDDHDGGTTFKEKFPRDDGSLLYVGIYPPANTRAKVLISNIDHVEKECVKRYKQMHGRYPVCNEIMPPG